MQTRARVCNLPHPISHTLQTRFEQTHPGITPKSLRIYSERLQCHCYCNFFFVSPPTAATSSQTTGAHTFTLALLHKLRQSHIQIIKSMRKHTCSMAIHKLSHLFPILVCADLTNNPGVPFLLNWGLNFEAWSSESVPLPVSSLSVILQKAAIC